MSRTGTIFAGIAAVAASGALIVQLVDRPPHSWSVTESNKKKFKFTATENDYLYFNNVGTGDDKTYFDVVLTGEKTGEIVRKNKIVSDEPGGPYRLHFTALETDTYTLEVECRPEKPICNPQFSLRFSEKQEALQ